MATPQPETIANGQPLAQPQSLQVDGQVEQYDAQVQIQGMPIVDGEDRGMSQGAEEDNVNGDGGGEAEQAEEGAEGGADGKTGGEPGEGDKTKKKRRAAATLEHEGGKSIFPVSRVQRIMKADRDLPIVAKEAVLLISLATEEFISRFAQAVHRVAEKERRVTVQPRDCAIVVHKADEFAFLEELLGWHAFSQITKPKRKPKAVEEKRDKNAEPTMLDRFIGKTGEEREEEEEEGQGDVVMNEDGTMGVRDAGEVL